MKCIYCGNHMRLETYRLANYEYEVYFSCGCGARTPRANSEADLNQVLDAFSLSQDGLKYRVWEAGYEAGKAAK